MNGGTTIVVANLGYSILFTLTFTKYDTTHLTEDTGVKGSFLLLRSSFFHLYMLMIDMAQVPTSSR